MGEGRGGEGRRRAEISFVFGRDFILLLMTVHMATRPMLMLLGYQTNIESISTSTPVPMTNSQLIGSHGDGGRS